MILINKLFNWRVLLVCLLLLLSYGQTLQMYFWQDDSALIFKLQNPAPAAGSFGEGIIGNGPYKYLVTPFVPFYPLFKNNPFGYFFVGFVLLLPVTYFFYLFSKQLFKDKQSAYFATLIFASGYVGSEIIFRVINSWQSNIGLCLALISFYYFCKHLNKGHISSYILAFVFYYFATKFVYVRSHSLIFIYLGIDIFINLFPLKFSKIINIFIRQFLFWIIFYLKYIGGGTAGSSSISDYLHQLLAGQYDLLLAIFTNFANGLVHSPLQEKIIAFSPGHYLLISSIILLAISWLVGKNLVISITSLLIARILNNYFVTQKLFWYYQPKETLSGYIGFFLFVFIFLYWLKFFKNKSVLTKSLIIGSLIVVSQILSYSIQFDYPPAIYDTTHRYFNYSMIGFSVFYGGICFYFYEKHKSIVKYAPLILVLAINIFFSLTYQRQLIKGRSEPSRNFYRQLIFDAPNIKPGAIVYFDVEAKHQYQQEFRDFFSVGSMPEETAIAIYYGIDRDDIKLVTEYNELLSLVAHNNPDINQIYYFAYGSKGLIDKSHDFRQTLVGRTNQQDLKVLQNTVYLEKSTVSTPILVQLKLEKKDNEDIDFPFNINQDLIFSEAEKKELLSYFQSRDQYYDLVSAKSESEWKYQEVFNVADKDVQTSWRGHRIYWNDNEHDSVTLDLSQEIELGKVVWINWHHTLTPINYYWESSVDGHNWIEVKRVKNGPVRADNEQVVEDLKMVTARYLRLQVDKTATNDAPAISEIEVVPSQFNGMDIARAFEFINDPYTNLTSIPTDSGLMRYVYFNVTAYSNTGDQQEYYLPFNSLGTDEYSLVVWPKDMTIKTIKLSLEAKYPFQIKLLNANFTPLNLDEIMGRGLLIDYSEN